MAIEDDHALKVASFPKNFKSGAEPLTLKCLNITTFYEDPPSVFSIVAFSRACGHT